MSFTLVFDGSVRAFKANPLTTKTEFGTPYAASIGDSFEEADIMREALEEIRDGAENPEEIAERAFNELDDIMKRELATNSMNS